MHCGRLGAHGCSGFRCHPTATQGRPCSVRRSLGAVGTGIMRAARSLPLVPHGDPGNRTLPHRGPCRAWEGEGGHTLPRPAPPCFPPPIRDLGAAPAPSANQSLAPILFTANPRGRRGRGQHGRFPASQSAPGCARGRGGGRGRSPWRAWHMAGSRRGAAGAGLRCWGVRPGCRRRSPAGIRASRCSCRQMWAHWTPWQCCSPRVSPQNGGVHQPPNHPCLTWSPPALWLAGSSPGSCHSCCWRGCPLIWAPHG